jgi:5-methylcytosine-specific restriction enzyme A
MPPAPLKHCLEPGCSALVARGRCPVHHRAARRIANRFTEGTYGRPWRRIRNAWIADHPFCVVCLAAGVLELGADVDHIIPHRGDRGLLLDPHNLQTLCETHHGQKTARESGFTG